MLGTIQSTIAAQRPKEIEALIKLLIIASKKEEYAKFIESEGKSLPDYESRKSLLNIGMFSGLDFITLVMRAENLGGTNLQLLSHLLSKLCNWLIVSDNGILSKNLICQFRRETEKINHFLSLEIIDNILFGLGYIAEKYKPSIPPIIVKKNEDIRTGTGFLVGGSNSTQKLAVVTAAHNVDPDQGVEVVSIGMPGDSAFRPISEKWTIHPSLDIAAVLVELPEQRAPIWPIGQPTVLNRTVTLGYPRIATADGPYLLAHSGEVNALVTSYNGEHRLIISNLVAPGNSGGPVLDESGLCIGMVVSSFETEYEGGRSIANSAIPAGAIMQFVLPMIA